MLRYEPLEERQLLAVDVFGKLGDSGAFDDHDSSCVSHISCCETTHLDETAQYYGRYFVNEDYSPVRPMVLDDWVVYDTFMTWKAEVSPEIFESVRNFFSHDTQHKDNVDPEMVQQAVDALPPPQVRGKIVPLVFGQTPVEFDDDGGVMHTMSGGSGGSGGSGVVEDQEEVVDRAEPLGR